MSKPRSSLVLRAHIEKDIVAGRLRSAEPLPKVEFYAREHRISGHTVLGAFSLLRKSGLIHKSGKRWVVGRIPPAPAAMPAHARPFFLIIQPHHGYWAKLNDMRTGRFPWTFAEEAQKHRIHLVAATLEDASDFMTPLVGARMVLATAQSSGSRYLGSIFTGESEHLHANEALLLSLMRLRKPIVWLDRKGIEPVPFDRRCFAACRFSERRMAGAVVKYLAGMGHRVMAYAERDRTDWQVVRRGFLLEAASRHGKPTRIVTVQEAASAASALGWRALGLRLRREHGTGAAHVRKTISFFLSVLRATGDRYLPPERNADAFERVAWFLLHWPGLGDDPEPLWNLRDHALHLMDGTITAFIAPRDFAAQLIYRKLMQIGIAVPEELSLISFDNYLDFTSLPVTTLDIGADNLGYWAFHALLRDLPVKRDKEGAILALPRIIDRGSVKYQPAP